MTSIRQFKFIEMVADRSDLSGRIRRTIFFVYQPDRTWSLLVIGLTNRTVGKEDRWDIRKLLADLRRSFPTQNGESLLVMEVCSIDTRSLVPEDFITIHHYSVCADCRYKHLTLSCISKIGIQKDKLHSKASQGAS